MPKYLNADKREGIYWACATKGFFMDKQQYYTGKPLTWLNSIMLSLDCFIVANLKNISPDEDRAIRNTIKRVTPSIVVSRVVTSDRKPVQVDAEIVDDLAEFSLENCKNCKENPNECKLRKTLLELGIPPYVEEGPCPYWQGGSEEA